MKALKLMSYALWLASLASCGASARKDTETKPVEQKDTVDAAVLTENTENAATLITSVYDTFVFAIDSDGNEINNPEKYFTPHALAKLQEDYEFDCDEGPCYAYYALRTEAQDSRPGSDATSRIYSIEPDGNGWYIVSYSDMGWTGKTRIRIADGKIDDYERSEQQLTAE